jgi:hypothetical protein
LAHFLVVVEPYQTPDKNGFAGGAGSHFSIANMEPKKTGSRWLLPVSCLPQQQLPLNFIKKTNEIPLSSIITISSSVTTQQLW